MAPIFSGLFFALNVRSFHSRCLRRSIIRSTSSCNCDVPSSISIQTCDVLSFQFDNCNALSRRSVVTAATFCTSHSRATATFCPFTIECCTQIHFQKPHCFSDDEFQIQFVAAAIEHGATFEHGAAFEHGASVSVLITQNLEYRIPKWRERSSGIQSAPREER